MKKFFPVLISIFLVFIAIVFFQKSSRAVEEKDLSVTATVAARPIDFQVELSPLSPVVVFHQDQVVEYEISYGSRLSYAAPMTLVAGWGIGTIDGAQSPSVDLLDYEIGSATNGYFGISPVIDNINRKITWNFSSFPGNTLDRKVRFAVKTNGNFRGSAEVHFPVSTFILGAGTQTPKDTVFKKYRFFSPQGPTPTPTIQLQTTGSPSPSPTPTPRAAQRKPTVFLEISPSAISDSDAKISLKTSRSTSVTIQYGERAADLAGSISSAKLARRHGLLLEDLKSNTQYFYKVRAVDSTGAAVSSDIFTFKTALPSTQPEVKQESIIITSNNVVLTDASSNKSTTPSVPKNTSYSFQFTIPNDTHVKQVQTILRHRDILGIFSAEAEEPNSLLTDAIQIKPGVYVGQLKTPSQPGYYELYARITDTNGNIVENKLTEIKVTNRFTVKDKLTNQPIEAVRVYFLLYNAKKKNFEPLTGGTTTIENPSYTDLKGELSSVLSSGSYKAQISTLGYKNKEVSFKIGADKGQVFPTVYLEPTPTSLLSSFAYYGSVAGDFFNLTRNYIKDISVSARFFQFIALIVVSVCVILSILSFSVRLGIPPWSIPAHIVHHFRFHYVEPNLNRILNGTVKDETGKPVSDANIFILDPHNNIVKTHTSTDAEGIFRLFKLHDENLKILFMKEGYIPTVKFRSLVDHNMDEILEVSLSKKDTPFSIFVWIVNLQKQFLGLSFEALLVVSVILEFALGYYFSWEKTLPFFIISIANIFLWGFHLHLSKKGSLLS